MSQSKAKYEASRWYQTAREDFEAAKALEKDRFYSHACYMAQQCAEKAVKALWFYIDADPWGHSIQRLVLQIPNKDLIADIETWLENGALLDKYYIPTRYPNGLPDLTPGQSYTAKDAMQAIKIAAYFLENIQEIFDVG
jgi:HEPN domain-containing protein